MDENDIHVTLHEEIYNGQIESKPVSEFLFS